MPVQRDIGELVSEKSLDRCRKTRTDTRILSLPSFEFTANSRFPNANSSESNRDSTGTHRERTARAKSQAGRHLDKAEAGSASGARSDGRATRATRGCNGAGGNSGEEPCEGIQGACAKKRMPPRGRSREARSRGRGCPDARPVQVREARRGPERSSKMEMALAVAQTVAALLMLAIEIYRLVKETRPRKRDR